MRSIPATGLAYALCRAAQRARTHTHRLTARKKEAVWVCVCTTSSRSRESTQTHNTLNKEYQINLQQRRSVTGDN